MKQKPSLKYILVISFLVLTISLSFQNCGMTKGSIEVQMDSFSQQLSMGSLGQTDVTHPAAKEISFPNQKNLVVNRDYIEVLFKEIFTNTATGQMAPGLEDLIDRWVLTRGAQHGLGCDQNSSYTGKDCGGDVSAANLPQTMDHNAVRESFLIQLCEGVLGSDDGLNILLSNSEIQNLSQQEPNFLNVQTIYYLFYRSVDESSRVINLLLELDAQLKKSSEPLIERWRAIAIEICESPGWQKL